MVMDRCRNALRDRIFDYTRFPRTSTAVATFERALARLGVSAQKIEFSGFDLMQKQMILC